MSAEDRRPARGALPSEATGEHEVAGWIRNMFARVAPRYDLLNRLLSFHLDRYWRWKTARFLRPVLLRPGTRVLDVCCGTGDLVLRMERTGRRPVLGCDFCRPMLLEARRKCARAAARSELVEADALRLPFRNETFHLVTVAFGFRNLADYRAGLKELQRVLAPGGMLAILEFTTPPNRAFRTVYRFYSQSMLPRIGGWISGSADAYRYLPESVRKFPAAPGLAEWMREAGFRQVSYIYMSLGIVALHTGVKST